MFIKVNEAASRMDPSNVEESLVAYEELEDYLTAAEEALALFTDKGWEGTCDAGKAIAGGTSADART